MKTDKNLMAVDLMIRLDQAKEVIRRLVATASCEDEDGESDIRQRYETIAANWPPERRAILDPYFAEELMQHYHRLLRLTAVAAEGRRRHDVQGCLLRAVDVCLHHGATGDKAGLSRSLSHVLDLRDGAVAAGLIAQDQADALGEGVSLDLAKAQIRGEVLRAVALDPLAAFAQVTAFQPDVSTQHCAALRKCARDALAEGLRRRLAERNKHREICAVASHEAGRRHMAKCLLSYLSGQSEPEEEAFSHNPQISGFDRVIHTARLRSTVAVDDPAVLQYLSDTLARTSDLRGLGLILRAAARGSLTWGTVRRLLLAFLAQGLRDPVLAFAHGRR